MVHNSLFIIINENMNNLKITKFNDISFIDRALEYEFVHCQSYLLLVIYIGLKKNHTIFLHPRFTSFLLTTDPLSESSLYNNLIDWSIYIFVMRYVMHFYPLAFILTFANLFWIKKNCANRLNNMCASPP